MTSRAMQILVVEDDAVSATNMKAVLESAGHRVVGIAPAGERAIDDAEKFKPDLILMDIRLKGELDGIEAAGFIRSDSRIPIVFVTAYGADDVRQRAKAVNPSGILDKLLDEKLLLKTVEKVRKKRLFGEAREDAENNGQTPEDAAVDFAVKRLKAQLVAVSYSPDFESRILDGYFLGYLLGFSWGILSAGAPPSAKKLVMIKRIFKSLFGETGGQILDQAYERQSDPSFLMGRVRGWAEAKSALGRRTRPMGLIRYLHGQEIECENN